MQNRSQKHAKTKRSPASKMRLNKLRLSSRNSLHRNRGREVDCVTKNTTRIPCATRLLAACRCARKRRSTQASSMVPPPHCFTSCLAFVSYRLRQTHTRICKSCRGKSGRKAINNVAATHQKVVAARFTPCAKRNSDFNAGAPSDRHRLGRSEKRCGSRRDTGAGSTT